MQTSVQVVCIIKTKRNTDILTILQLGAFFRNSTFSPYPLSNDYGGAIDIFVAVNLLTCLSICKTN